MRSENNGCITPLLVDEKKGNEKEKPASKLIPLVWYPSSFFFSFPVCRSFSSSSASIHYFFSNSIQDA